ncbi:formyltransferase family protein [Pararobbsia silviterrae]|uniref:Formyl transferase n=1 Tax=Pararobbsia silviterrae TaxID=1792498 RepID=A0A494Y9T4_9BURK|nr:formyltransferase family protein [Pararobbsia silviterrae]RKP56660.1 formyl transferase [Pararobbsia silviterrae]
MRFAIATVPRYQVVLNAFVEAGWEPVKIFSTNLLSTLESNSVLLDRAERLRVPIQLSKIEPRDLEALAQAGCTTLVVAGHPWRIPEWRPHLQYAVNFHPSPLPEARGPYPHCRAIRERRREWGISCHKIETSFDTGDVLAQSRFAMHANETHETLDLKIQFAMAVVALDIARDLPKHWAAAKPQQGGDYWPFDSDADRTLDFTQSVDEVMLKVRACGLLECMATVEQQKIHISRAEGWVQAHGFPPGTLVHRNGKHLVVAAADGFIALLEWSTLSLNERRVHHR